ncbi:transition state regulatory protein [Listeria fleischmannii 1991]|uniref:Transition state regulatory protein AbrB n=2 Tax=Listeria fleischmannii TaxID=1069827 RepID=A0A2X3HG34_9LIST|nr:AbrB/MazE/SpoVT family DNA-binding domain-containing protein [Listeria fleischmannii]EMG26933.1 pleiotrophic regulator of transition state gene [Listeria fleischmannii subsp. fleischmannii LU2006-1]KMT57747.1 transition state regulatory protein [Listeria fleischmannii 1991]SQC70154.1 Transition state regulatory protein AbrB [Listeria fleischmannii subsp. fleischmannii]
MKSTGIVRKIDELGRIVIPIEIRRTLGIQVKDPLEIFIESDSIIFKKYNSDLECDITGTVSPTNKHFLNGKLTLSKEGADELIAEIRRQFDE